MPGKSAVMQLSQRAFCAQPHSTMPLAGNTHRPTGVMLFQVVCAQVTQGCCCCRCDVCMCKRQPPQPPSEHFQLQFSLSSTKGAPQCSRLHRKVHTAKPVQSIPYASSYRTGVARYGHYTIQGVPPTVWEEATARVASRLTVKGYRDPALPVVMLYLNAALVAVDQRVDVAQLAAMSASVRARMLHAQLG